MDFNKLSQQASSFMNKNQGQGQAPTDSNNTSTSTNDTSNTGGSMGNQGPNQSSSGMMGGMLGGLGSSNQNPNANQSSTNEDYGDKGLDFIEQKTGHTLSREQNEKITDGARGMFEKVSGKTLDSKWSN